MSVMEAFQSFIQDTATFQRAVDQSTAASWGGGGYSVELFDDGTHRVLWDQNIGNMYNSPGLILPIPALADEELIKDTFNQHFQANLNTQHIVAMG